MHACPHPRASSFKRVEESGLRVGELRSGAAEPTAESVAVVLQSLLQSRLHAASFIEEPAEKTM